VHLRVDRGVTTKRWSAAGAFVAWLLPACVQSDVGAPCNHGPRDAPRESAITYPALACDELMCVYAESADPPVDPCQTEIDCNVDGGTRFDCVEGRCELALDHVLERSMCSRPCGSDADCDDGSVDTACNSGFMCTPLLSLGKQCCQKVCACRDDLAIGDLEELAEDCAAGDSPGCCDREPRPRGCGG
jgi:hypothetical protein